MQEHLYGILEFTSIKGFKDPRPYLLNKDTIDKHWSKVFVHPSVNIDYNYEKLEFLGDINMNYGFKKYLIKSFGVTTPNDLSLLTSYYMSEKYQYKIANHLELSKFVKIDPLFEVSNKILEDVVESFFGIFAFLMKKLYDKDPISFLHPTEYIEIFFERYFIGDRVVDFSKAQIAIKNMYMELYHFFSGLGNNENPYFNNRTGKYVYNKKYLEGISKYNSNIVENVKEILENEKNEENIISKVYNILSEAGLDYEWRKEEIKNTSFSKEITELAKTHNLTRFVLQRNSPEGGYDLLAQSRGLDKRSVSKILQSYDHYLSLEEIRENAEKYIKEKYD